MDSGGRCHVDKQSDERGATPLDPLGLRSAKKHPSFRLRRPADDGCFWDSLGTTPHYMGGDETVPWAARGELMVSAGA